MRRSAKWVTAVLILLLAGLVGSVAAQKGKPVPAPSYVWEVTLPEEGDLASNIYGPGLPFVSGVNGVTASAGYNGCDGCDVSGFKLGLSIPSDLATRPWIGYRDLVYKSGDIPGSPCHYPTFNSGGLLLDNGDFAEPPNDNSCVLAFLSHKHPQYPYLATRLEVQLQHIDVLSMAPGSSALVAVGYLLTNVTGASCSPDAYSNVAGSHLSSSGPVWVTRLTEDEWKVELSNHPLVVGEWQNVPGRAKNKCESIFPSVYARAQGISATLTWRRRLLQ